LIKGVLINLIILQYRSSDQLFGRARFPGTGRTRGGVRLWSVDIVNQKSESVCVL